MRTSDQMPANHPPHRRRGQPSDRRLGASTQAPRPSANRGEGQRRPRWPRFFFALYALCPGVALAESPAVPADIVEKLQSFDPQKGDVMALLKAVVPKLSTLYLKLPPGAEVQKGGPLSEVLSPAVLDKLNASPGSLPLVVYRKEDGRLPAAFILARYRGVLPSQMGPGLVIREAAVRHPLVSQSIELRPPSPLPEAPWSAGTVHKSSSAFCTVDMPFGAGLFGLRGSFVFADWDIATLQNGITLESYLDRLPTPQEVDRFRTFKDKKGKERTLEDDYYQVKEYRLTHLLIPERDETGKLANTIQVYFVRIVPALKPGTDLVGSGALARWIFARGAQEALITPVKLIRDAVEKEKEKLRNK